MKTFPISTVAGWLQVHLRDPILRHQSSWATTSGPGRQSRWNNASAVEMERNLHVASTTIIPNLEEPLR